jgi:secreted trypsin-like serine protease
MRGETAVLVLREHKSDGTYARRDHTLAIRQGETPLWTKHAKEDLAVLRLTEPLPQPIRPLPFSALADVERLKEEEIHTCSSIFVLTYPQRFEANDGGFPVARQGIIADHPFLPTPSNHRYLADFNTFAGDSGGPVFVKAKNGRPLVIGVVLARFNHDERIKTEYEERLIRHPLGLGSVLYPQLVREAIVAAAKSRTAEAAK